jgi:hypothetical protein
MGLPNRQNKGKHERDLPTPRKIRRSCQRELYRTVKRLKTFIPPDKVEEAERLYYRKVIENLIWIAENGSNRKLLADWWEEHVAPDIAKLWQVDEQRLAAAFRDGFGG